MKPVELKVARIGNSRGVRIPAATLQRYRIGERVVMEERSEGILLRPSGSASVKLSWPDTAAAMAATNEDWDAWDATSADGVDRLEWSTKHLSRVGEGQLNYRGRRKKE